MIKDKSLSKKEYNIVSKLFSEKINIITIDEASKILRIKKRKLWDIFHRLEKKLWLERIEKGKYMMVPFYAKKGWLEHPFVITSNLIKNYYISYRTALAHYGLTEQIPVYVYIATTERKNKLEYKLQNYIFRFVRINKKKFFGFKSMLINNRKVFIAEKEKAIIDCLDKEKYAGTIIEIAKSLDNKDINLVKLKRYAMRMNNYSLIRRLGYLLEMLKKDYSGLEKRTGNYRNVYLSTILPMKNLEINKKWKLIINIRKEDLLIW